MLRRTVTRACVGHAATSYPFRGWDDAKCAEEIKGKKSSEEVHQLFVRMRGGGGEVGMTTYKAALKALTKFRGNDVAEKFHDVYNTLLVEPPDTGMKADAEVFTQAIQFWAGGPLRFMDSEAGFCLRMVLAHMGAMKVEPTAQHAPAILRVAVAAQDERLANQAVDILHARDPAAVNAAVLSSLVTASATLEGLEAALARAQTYPGHRNLHSAAVEHVLRLTARNARGAADVRRAENIFMEQLASYSGPADQKPRGRLIAGMMNMYNEVRQHQKVVDVFEALPIRERSTPLIYVHAIEAYHALHLASGDPKLAAAAERAHTEAVKAKNMGFHSSIHKAIALFWLRGCEGEKAMRLMQLLKEKNIAISQRLQKTLQDILRVSGYEEPGIKHAPRMHVNPQDGGRGFTARYF